MSPGCFTAHDWLAIAALVVSVAHVAFACVWPIVKRAQRERAILRNFERLYPGAIAATLKGRFR